MQMRKIGSLNVSEVGLGCNNFGRRIDASATTTVVNAALDAGINFFDTADVYGGGGLSETYLAHALGNRRKDVIIATKFGNTMEGVGKGAHPDYIRVAVEASLKRLETDYIDLYQLHVPDPEVPLADTLGALDTLVKAGKVREIGCSNFSAEQLCEGEAIAKQSHGARFVSVQNEYSLFKREDEKAVLPECAKSDIAYLPYFPLASGLLTGKYRKDQPLPESTRIAAGNKWLTDENFDAIEGLIQFAEAHHHTILQLAMSWLLRLPTVASVIAGATKPEQINANVGAAGWKLTDEELKQIDAILAATLSQPAAD